MKFIYTLLAIVAMVAFASCTDTDPQPITTIECEASVDVVTPFSVTFALKVNSDNKDVINNYRAIVTNSEGDESVCYFDIKEDYTAGTVVYGTVGFSGFDYGDFFPQGKEFSYQIVAYADLSTNYGDNRIILDEGTFTVPTVEEYFGGIELEESFITSNSAVITINLPKELKIANTSYLPKLEYSSSADFSNKQDKDASQYLNKNNKLTYILTDLRSETKYFVKINGGFECGDYSMREYELITSPDSFTTLSDGQVVSNVRCILTENYILDNSASISINIPGGWTLYKEYTNDPVNCTVIYSTDPSFKDYVDLNVKPSYDSYYKSYSFSALITDLIPETTYYVALKGDFECNQVNQVLKDYIMPADKSFTTLHTNQVEMIDGHAAVNLGLSVKWATEDVTNGTKDYFAWPEVSGIKDIAGTEYDIAKKYWGGSWQMPSQEQFMELLEKCDVIVRGNHLCIIGSTDNYILIPFDANQCYYWTSTAGSTIRNSAVCFGSYSISHIVNKAYHSLFREIEINPAIGYPVRAVTKK